VIDDMAHLKHYYADILLNQNLHAEQLHYPCEPYTRLLLGTRYVLLRREFLGWKDRKREIPEIARRVLVTLGGGDPENYTLKVIQALQKVDVSGLEATVVVGASNPHANVLEAAIGQSSIPIHLSPNARNMPELMAWADVAVSGAGVTSWELAYMGVPMLVVTLALNQETIARALQKKGIALSLNQEHVHTSTEVNLLVQELLANRQARGVMSRIGRAVVDGQGAQRVLECLSSNVTP
jgi:UDP-2,4-diacetamido-2,4,6-trideoxy-beta-L-altropyranose hydrolase